MKYNRERIKKQIQAEIELHDRFGPGRIWSFILKEIFHNNTLEAKNFMLSPAGGFDIDEVNRIERQQQTREDLHLKNYH